MVPALSEVQSLYVVVKVANQARFRSRQLQVCRPAAVSHFVQVAALLVQAVYLFVLVVAKAPLEATCVSVVVKVEALTPVGRYRF